MILTTSVGGKQVKISVQTVRVKSPDEDGVMHSRALPVGKVIIKDAGRRRTILYGEIERKDHYTYFYHRMGGTTYVHTVLAYAMNAMLQDYLRNRDNVSWENAK